MIARALLVLLLASAGAAGAHPLEPSLLELTEDGGGRVAVAWTTPTRGVPGVVLRPLLPESCRPVDAPAVEDTGERIVTRWHADCGPNGLVGERVSVSDIADGRSDVLVRVRLADGRLVHGVITADTPDLVVPARQPPLAIAAEYVRLGVHHILAGWDHLLFVLGLLLLTRGRSLLATLTAFTLGHSVTLSLAVLRVVSVPQRPVEVLIAASVFLLAVELARDPTAPPSALARRPWLMAMAFGLLHGLGFAGALAEVGLPDGDIPLALGAFNVGIEVGQIAVVAVALVAARVVPRAAAIGPRLPAYAIGSLAAYWVIERAAALFGAA